MQHCEECGTELPNEALFCGRCGRKTASENELATGFGNAPIEDIPMSPSAISMALNDSQDFASENEEEEQTPALPSENNAEEEVQTSYLTSENEEEEQTPNPASEKQQEQLSLYPISEHENEEQTHQEYFEPTSSTSDDADSEPEILVNQFPDEQPQYTQTPKARQETQRPYASAQKPESRPLSRCLLFSLAGLIVVAGVVAALMGLFHLNLPGFGRSSNVLSNS
ncbi:MAG TPA: zinc ribbon domain-containing protein, partial [Ktedonobacteraceae bacterium]